MGEIFEMKMMEMMRCVSEMKNCRLFVELPSFIYGHFRGGPMEKYRVSALLFEVQKLAYFGALEY